MPTKLRSTGVQFPDTSVQTTALPIGTVAIWSGSVASIPTGWWLCDGTNGTPNMVDRFFVGAGSTYAMGATGGSSTVTLTAPQISPHSHSISITLSPNGGHSHSIDPSPGGAHTHATGAPAAQPVLRSGTPALELYTPGSTGPSQTVPGAMNNAGSPHTHTVTVTANGTHTHTVSVTLNNAGASDPHDNMPPYYALAFIMKVI